MKRKILITGSNGLIGRELVNQLLTNKQNVLTLILRKNKVFKKNKNLKIIIEKNLSKKSKLWWAKKINFQDFVYHLAWSVKDKDYLENYKNIECLNMSVNIALASMNKVKNFISLGTCLEYKKNNQVLSNLSNVQPENLYASCKLSTFYILNNIFKNSNTKFKWLRVFYIYSENDHKKKLVPTLIEKLKKNKKIFIKNPYVIRDYISLEKAVQKIIFSHKKIPTIQNICSSKGTSPLKIAKDLEKKFNKKKLVTFSKKKKVIDSIIGKN